MLTTQFDDFIGKLSHIEQADISQKPNIDSDKQD